MSTKLTLLVVIPLAMTLAVTLPLTVTGLNKLASVTSTERLEDEVLLVDKNIGLFETELNRVADDFSQDPILLAMARESNGVAIKNILMAAKIRLGVEHLEVVDGMGMSLGHEHEPGAALDSQSMNELNALGLAKIGKTELVQTPGGWFLASARPLVDADGIMGAVVVGRLIDNKALAEMNLNRSDPIMVLLGDDDEVVSASFLSGEKSTRFSMVPDSESVRAARMGQIVIGSAIIDGTNHRTAYVPVALGSGSSSVFAVSLTKSPVVGLRDELIADQVMVTAALSLLVLGVGYVVTRTITRRIMRLRDGAVEIGNGNLSFRIEESAHDEMGTLAREFNRMSDRLKEKNNQLEEANRDLEQRVSERTEELQQANIQLIDAQIQLVRTEKFGALGEFSAGVAHDLRNPLGAIRNGIYFLKSRMARSGWLNTEPKVSEYLTVMDERITQCDKIIEDLISFTRISTPVYSSVTLFEVLESTLSGIETPDGISVITDYGDSPVDVQADPLQLRRVFTNLIVNAYEAMSDGGELTVAVKAEGPSAEVMIKDTGPGISPEGLEKIFEPLYTTKIQGTGLGLSVCQHVISKHNGILDVHSKVGVGTTFTVGLPLTAVGR
ncbi:MAG: HAMP domain-containing protein [Chloroflexi bacterium]|nr:HAMP domain-containing protein [Chloroflexota bacterium]